MYYYSDELRLNGAKVFQPAGTKGFGIFEDREGRFIAQVETTPSAHIHNKGYDYCFQLGSDGELRLTVNTEEPIPEAPFWSSLIFMDSRLREVRQQAWVRPPDKFAVIDKDPESSMKRYNYAKHDRGLIYFHTSLKTAFLTWMPTGQQMKPIWSTLRGEQLARGLVIPPRYQGPATLVVGPGSPELILHVEIVESLWHFSSPSAP